MASRHRASKLSVHIDDVGKVLSRSGSPFSAGLNMQLVRKDLRAELKVTTSPYSNGSAWVAVFEGKKKIYEAKGNYTSDFYNWKETVGETTYGKIRNPEQCPHYSGPSWFLGWVGAALKTGELIC